MKKRKKITRKPVPRPKGRPSTITQDVKVKLVKAFSAGANVIEACDYADVNRHAFYVYCEKDSDFRDKIQGLRNRPNLSARFIIQDSLEKGDVKIAQWQLERADKLESERRRAKAIRDASRLEKSFDGEDPSKDGYLSKLIEELQGSPITEIETEIEKENLLCQDMEQENQK